ncbi:thiamine pyrophosphate-dependent enzyme [Pseudovibrio sp. WM33]|uniref:thiamine pyrophosphate-dependent enzyme n=1 Tax=Pseudovibrio sp. WM33 TaxID=1735585 RepID=UPI0007B2174B|nr:thiamine pyrophosphate-dependent enzyme [Pseudovibrio sp. WM33]KZL24642.1 hypothetical protein PsWM33_02496 [Pseudovibrio sp. WM33]
MKALDMDVSVNIIVITRNSEFFRAGASVILDFRDDLFETITIDSDWDILALTPSAPGPHYSAARDRAVRFLSGSGDRISLHVVQSQSLSGALTKLMARSDGSNVHHTGMAYIDYSDPYHFGRSIAEIDQDLQEFYGALHRAQVPAFETPSSTAVFQSAEMHPYQVHPMNFIRCVLPSDSDVLRAQLLTLWMDFYQLSLANRHIKCGDKGRPTSAMASCLAKFLDSRTEGRWVLQYYTGSLVSSLISAFEDQAEIRNFPVLRGPSEHALACGAMANWQLYEMPSVTIITSGMVDEFRGTLANLRETRACGFVICAEQKPALWYAFQSTINPESDSRDVLHARGVPFVYIDDPANLQAGMNQAMQLYDANRGPVFILATQSVMNVVEAPENLPPPALVRNEPVNNDTILHLAELINNGPDRLLLQPGQLHSESARLLASIAERAGIALVDSIIHPGAIPTHLNGRPCPNHLGTLSVYGFSDAVYRFLHRDGQIAPKTEQTLIFLGDKVSQVVTPFTENKLHRKFHIAQVVSEHALVAPFADISVLMQPHAALKELEERLDVKPELLARRRDTLTAALKGQEDLSRCVPSLPMTPNFFFGALGQLLTEMIEAEGYDFTSLFDVGRCGVSAIRNLPKTRAGFSGWYGRALMGDAHLATLALAETCPTDLLSFIGDGAFALVPDILPSLLENALSNGARRNRSVTTFVLCNSGLSAINSYQERILFNRTSRQMRILNLSPEESAGNLCGYEVVKRTINVFDKAEIRKALKMRGRINIFHVNLAHNNEGDGMSLAHVRGWQQDQLPRFGARRVSQTIKERT